MAYLARGLLQQPGEGAPVVQRPERTIAVHDLGHVGEHRAGVQRLVRQGVLCSIEAVRVQPCSQCIRQRTWRARCAQQRPATSALVEQRERIARRSQHACPVEVLQDRHRATDPEPDAPRLLVRSIGDEQILGTRQQCLDQLQRDETVARARMDHELTTNRDPQRPCAEHHATWQHSGKTGELAAPVGDP